MQDKSPEEQAAFIAEAGRKAKEQAAKEAKEGEAKAEEEAVASLLKIAQVSGVAGQGAGSKQGKAGRKAQEQPGKEAKKGGGGKAEQEAVALLTRLAHGRLHPATCAAAAPLPSFPAPVHRSAAQPLQRGCSPQPQHAPPAAPLPSFPAPPL